jgi:hexokinase
MEPPVTLAAEDVRDEKVKVLRSTQPIREEDIVVGQYKSNGEPGVNSYLDEDGVPADSRTPTFATAVIYIQNQRWTGVPFVLKSGKALNERKAEVRVQFRDSPHFLYTTGDAGTAVEPIRATPADVRRASVGAGGPSAAAAGSASPRSPAAGGSTPPAGVPAMGASASAPSMAGRGYDGSWLCAPILGPTNELVIRIQPDESVYLKMMSKMPGLDNTLESSELNLSFKKRYPGRKSPEAYARLIFDVLRGDQSQFVRNDELAAAWAIFTPILHRLEGAPGFEHLAPISLEPYRFGDRGPQASDQLLNRLGFKYDPAYSSSWNRHAEPATMRAVREELSLPLLELERVVRAFQEEMLKGLADNSPRASTVRQIYTYMDDKLTGREEGFYWGLDIGGTNIRLVKYSVVKGSAPVRVVSIGDQFDASGVYKKTIPHAVKVATGKELFAWLADACIEAGVAADEAIGFCFSFPYLQTGLNRGFLLYWTKEFSNAGVALDEVPDADADAMAQLEVANLLEAALASRGTAASVVAVVNDTVGTLVSGLRLDSATTMGLILGTGTNACYVEDKSRITKLPAGVPRTGKGVVCMEWGGFSAGAEEFELPKQEERLLPLTDFDIQVLSETAQPGRQVFEKLISGKYLGAIARAAIIKLFHAGEVFQASGIAADSCDLLTPLGGASKGALHAAASAAAEADAGVPDAEDSHGPLSTRMLFAIVKDLSASGAETRAILKSLGVRDASSQDVYITREVCKLVARRAARLVGMALSAVLRHIGADRGVDGNCAQPAVVAVDGSVFEHNTDFVVDSGREGFKSWVLEAMGELGVRAELSAIDSASFEGAAVVAAIASRRVSEGEAPQTLEQAAAACHSERSS